MSTLTRESPAKINLTLRVGPLRPDGFHEIESLIVQVRLCDVVGVTARDDGRLTLECDDPAIPVDETNLALRAARLLAEKAGVEAGVHIALGKRIPAGAGLGGGSSNAATTLLLLNELWRLGRQRAELAALGAQIGSDVPLFLHGPLCMVRGRGEYVEDIGLKLEGWVALILPDIHVATRDVYAAWDRIDTARRRFQNAELVIPDSVEDLMRLLTNDLEAPAFGVDPELSAFARRLGECAGGPVRMTGSGSAFFRLFDEKDAADGFARDVADRLGVRSVVVDLLTS